MSTRRLFIGISLSDALRKRLHREQEAWKELPVFPVDEENWHITLLFLGFLPERELPALGEKIETAARTVSVFDLDLREIVLAPEDGNPAMIWLVGEPSEDLRRLRQNLEVALGYRSAEYKRFRPHVTMARIRRTRWKKLSVAPALRKKLSLVEPVEKVTLFESLSENGKRRYQPLMEFPLGQ